MAETARGIRTRLERDPKWRELALRYKQTRTVVRKMTRPVWDAVAPVLARVPIPAGLSLSLSLFFSLSLSLSHTIYKKH